MKKFLPVVLALLLALWPTTAHAVIEDLTAPVTASVTTPADGSYYNASSMPATFSGSAADNSGGIGLNANSTTFTLKRNSDNKYWDGDSWETTATWLATIHDATTSNTTITWMDNITLPTWSDGTYTVQSKATDKAGNTLSGTAVSFTYDNTILVGVEVYPLNKLALLAPWLAVASILALVAAGGISAWRRRRT